ncbi:MAG: hypothetical protein WCO86_08170, partial [Planctomycetota bacterium]
MRDSRRAASSWEGDAPAEPRVSPVSSARQEPRPPKYQPRLCYSSKSAIELTMNREQRSLVVWRVTGILSACVLSHLIRACRFLM